MGNLSIKKFIIIIVNVIIMAAILVFVVFYSRFISRDSYFRQAVYGVGTGAMTIDEAVAGYGSFEQ